MNIKLKATDRLHRTKALRAEAFTVFLLMSLFFLLMLVVSVPSMPSAHSAWASEDQVEAEAKDADDDVIAADAEAGREAKNDAPGEQTTAQASEFRQVRREHYLRAEYAERSDAEIEQLLSNRLEYSQDGYQGSLPLVSLLREPVYRVDECPVERTTEFPGLPAPDVIYLPLTWEFLLQDGVEPGSCSPAILDYTAVSWSLDNSDAYGRPVSYTGIVTYRGIERVVVMDYLKVTAVYQGEVTESAGEETRSLEVAAAADAAAAPSEFFAELGAMTVPLAPAGEWQVPLAVVAGAALAVVMIGLLFLLLLFRYRNIKVVEFSPDGRARTLLRRHGRLAEGRVRLMLPDSVAALVTSTELVVLIKAPLAYQEGTLEVICDERTVFEHPLQPQIELSTLFRGELALSAFRLLEVAPL